MTSLLLRRFVRDYQSTSDPEVRARYALLEAGVSTILNLLLAAVMLGMGLAYNSIALMANAAHTASDVVSSITVFIGFRAARMPPDEKHPHGHGRAEHIATLIIAILLIILAYEFLVLSVSRLLHPQPVGGSVLVVVVLLASATVKEWMARFAVGLGRQVVSDTLVADAWHHRADAISMSLVSIGIISAMRGYSGVDSLLAGVVALVIGYTGFSLARQTVSKLIGEKPSEELLEKVHNVTRATHGVRDTHKIMVHDYGGSTHISLHIQVDPELQVTESHEIASHVKYRVASETGAEVIVHVEPHG